MVCERSARYRITMPMRWGPHDIDLANAVFELSIDGMRAALAAGANARCRDPVACDALATCVLETRQQMLSDPNANLLALQAAALRLLAEHGGLSADLGTESLHTAVSRAYSPVLVKILLDAGADVHGAVACFGGTEETALHAVLSPDIARLVISVGADVHAPDSAGNPPLARVLEHRGAAALETAVVLIEAGADVNAVNEDGRSCLHRVSAFTGAAHLPLLLASGADPTVVDTRGRTPLVCVLERVFVATGAVAARPCAMTATTLRDCVRAARMLAASAAWWRRRHLLLAVRSRYRGVDEEAAATAALATGAAANDSSHDSGLHGGSNEAAGIAASSVGQ